MKKISIIVMALAFLVALTQCKKEQATPANDGKTVDITLDIKSGKGTRMDVNTATGEVTFVNGDKIYVASGGKYVGTLTHNGTRFGGTITDPVVGEPLHFYFLGNVTPAETLTAGTTTTCSVVISDQTEHLPVIEYAPSNENYTGGTSSFTAHLLNKCALVKFNVNTFSETAICITGLKNKVLVSFSENTLTYSQIGNGLISLPSGDGEKWIILLPQDALEEGEQGSAYSMDGYMGTRGAVPATTENGYLTAGIQVSVTTKANQGEAPTGTINGKYTINANGDQVYFSQGNLQYQASSNIWRFADKQYDCIGSANNHISSSYSGWIDLFGWGTSGYHDSNDSYNVYYQPWSISYSIINEDYNEYGYGPSTNMMTLPNLTGNLANYDWGVYNPISNGGNQENLWRTLNVDEWYYVFNVRNTISDIRYAKAKVNNVNGIILLPDDWRSNTYNLISTNTYNADFSSNIVSATEWIAFENSGAVFLPAAGIRKGTSVSHVGSWGNYWSATTGVYSFEYNEFGSRYAYTVYILDNSFNTGTVSERYNGQSVRLVRDLQQPNNNLIRKTMRK